MDGRPTKGANATGVKTCDSALFIRNHIQRWRQPCHDPADENFVLRPSLQSNIMSVQEMQKESQSNQTGQTLEQARLAQEALRQPSHPILATQETSV
jgi:hypothetical protein